MQNSDPENIISVQVYGKIWISRGKNWDVNQKDFYIQKIFL